MEKKMSLTHSALNLNDSNKYEGSFPHFCVFFHKTFYHE